MQARFGVQGANSVGDLVYVVLFHLFPAIRAVSPPHTRKQQSQIVVDLGCSGDSRAGITGRILLANGNGRSNPVKAATLKILGMRSGIISAEASLHSGRWQWNDVAALKTARRQFWYQFVGDMPGQQKRVFRLVAK